jgi:flagellar biosynthesis protein FlhF
MKTALAQVKEELGTDAVIMSNKRVAGGVEIVAAIDGESSNTPRTQVQNYNSRPRHASKESEPLLQRRQLKDDQVQIGGDKRGEEPAGVSKRFASLLKKYTGSELGESGGYTSENEDSLAGLMERQARAKGEDAPRARDVKDLSSRVARAVAKSSDKGKFELPNYARTLPDPEPQSSFNEEEMDLLREDISSIRRLLEHQVSGLMWQEVERREPLRAMLIKRLERMGISLELADQLACYIPEDTPPPKAWNALLRLVSDQIPVSRQDILKRGGIVALLGPTGVGKTTTVAKLAARAAMEYGPDSVALVTTDTYRIGAHEQLAIYGRIMGCPVKVAKDSKELADVIYQLRNRRLILVDTAGMGQRDVRLSEQLDTLMQESEDEIHSYLVLPATAQRKVLQETIDHFRRIPLSGCIMTKLDESLSLGEFVSVVVENALPVSYIANGQRVPEDIVVAQPKYMVAKANELLEQSAENEPHYWTSEAERF